MKVGVDGKKEFNRGGSDISMMIHIFVKKSSGLKLEVEEISNDRALKNHRTHEKFETYSVRVKIDPLTVITLHNFSKDLYD